MASIACFEVEPWMKPILKNGLAKHALVFFEEPLGKQHISAVKSCEALVVFIYSPVTKEVLSSLPHLKLVATMSTGFDHIDVKACQKKKVIVCNVPFYGENTVAEHTMALLLAISRKIPQSIERTRKGDFSLDGLRGFDVKGKTMGIVGGGHIGMHVAKYARAFDMNVLVFDVFKNPKLATSLGFTYVSFPELLKRSDVISFHVPYNSKTHHMLNESNISKVKKGAVILNTARGGLIQTEALLHALDTGIISCAGLDVLEGECFIKEEHQLLSKHFAKICDLKTVLQDHLLLKDPRVFITPHNAFNSQEALTRILETTIENINGYFAKSPKNVVKG